MENRAEALPKDLPHLHKRAQDLVFFKALGGRPSQAHRTKVAGQMSLSGMRSISLHRLLELDFREKYLVVSVSPLTIESERCGEVPLLLNTAQLSAFDMKRVRHYTTDVSQVVLRLMNNYKVSPDQAKLLPKLLNEVSLSPAGSPLDAPWACEGRCRDLISRLETDGMLEGPPWKLTLQGREHLEVGIRLTNPLPVIARPERVDDNASVAQLICELDFHRWEHKVVGRTRAKKVAAAEKSFAPGAEKVWYTRQGQVTVHRLYLLALLTATGETKVPHFASPSVYKGILEGVVEPTRRERKSRARPRPIVPEGADWPDDRPAAAPRARQPQRRKRRKRPISPAESSSSSSSGEDEAPHAPAPEDACAEDPADHSTPARSDSDSSSSSSSSASRPSSSSSAASSSMSRSVPMPGSGNQPSSSVPLRSSGGQPLGSRDPLAPGPGPPPASGNVDASSQGQGELKRPGKGYPFGGNRVTEFKVPRRPTHRGFQMTCNHPLHKDEQAVCTKSRTQRAEEVSSGAQDRAPNT